MGGVNSGMAVGRYRRRRKHRINKIKLAYAVLFFLFVVAGVTAAVNLFFIHGSYAAAQSEYDDLRHLAPAVLAADSTPDPHPSTSDFRAIAPSATLEPSPDLSAINPDYIGWIRMGGTGIDYPVVQGMDNKKYLDTTFAGEKNAAGSIFMDAKCTDGFAAPLAILYGHNMKDGSMFAGLNQYLDVDYRRQYPEIEITTAEGETLRYRILTAQVTDIYDKAYGMLEAGADEQAEYARDIGAEKDTPLLILSTCTDTGGNEKRLLVHAALEK